MQSLDFKYCWKYIFFNPHKFVTLKLRATVRIEVLPEYLFYEWKEIDFSYQMNLYTQIKLKWIGHHHVMFFIPCGNVIGTYLSIYAVHWNAMESLCVWIIDLRLGNFTCNNIIPHSKSFIVMPGLTCMMILSLQSIHKDTLHL